MAKVHQKKVIAALLAASIAVPTPAFAASASDFTDFPKDWSAAALTHSVYNGLLSGSEGKIRASETLKRAEMAAIINRLAGAEKGASLDGYSDVPASAWYYQDMAKAVQLGTFVGDGSRLRPEEPMTRQEVLSVLARFYGLQGGSETALEKYADAENVAPWARNALAVMTECGYVHGAEGKIQPEKSITRAEFAQLLYNMAGNIANAGETISSDTAGNLIVRGTDTVLKNMTVHGDLILADGADKVVLENVEVKGRILVRGGSGEVSIRNSKAEKEIIVSNSHGTATILAEGSQLQNLKLRTDTNLQGSFANVEAEKPLRLTAEQGKIEQMTFQAGAERSVLLAKKEAEIASVHVAATGTEISGEGKIADITVKAKDVAVKTKGTKVTVSAGIEGTTADGKAVAADTVVVTEKTEEAKQKAEEKNGGEKKEESSGSTEDSGSSRKKKKKTEETGASVQTVGLADGEWYGTGTWSRYYPTKGPDIVKVTVKNGVISEVVSVVYTDDENPVYAAGKKIMERAKGRSDLSELKKQLDNRTGADFDAVSGATETAKGHLTAMENALARSRTYAADKQDQKIAWMEFKTKPATSVKLGSNLDLSKTEIRLHLTNGETKDITFDQIADYGITTNIQNGTKITKDTKELKDNALLVVFTHALSQTSIPVQISFLKETKMRMPTHLLVTFADKKTKRIDLEENKFRYSLKVEGEVTEAALYDGEEKIADGEFEKNYNSWKVDLKKVSAGGDYSGWKYESYYVLLDTSADQSEAVSFTLDTSQVPKNYGVGKRFDLSRLNIALKTKNGSSQSVNGWRECQKRGFSVSLENGHSFEKQDVGEKTITVSFGDVEQTFKINVVDYAAQVPAKVELYDSKTDKLIQTVKIPGTEWKKVKGCLMLRDVELPGEYKSWKVEDFKIKVYDADDRELMSSLYTAKLDYYKEALEIDFPQYKEYYTEGGYLKFYFKIGEISDTPKAEETEKEKEKEETSKTAEATARVKIMGVSESPFDYDVKVKVTYNEESGEIISVSDNKTDAGSANAEYWKKIQTIFEKFNGKKLEELDTVDAVSGATYSSQAIKEAVKKAISSKGDEVDAPKVRAEDHRTHLIYTAGPAVFHVDSPKEAQIYYTTDGSDPREENNGKKN